MEVLMRFSSKVDLLDFLTHIRLGWYWQAVINALAYKVVKFELNLIFFITYKWAQ